MHTNIEIPDPYASKLNKIFQNNNAAMQDFVAQSLEHYFEYLEDLQLGKMALEAEKNGYAGVDKTEKFLDSIRNA